VFKKPRPEDVFGEELSKVLKDFLPAEKPPEEKPDVSLILPACKSIVTVNTRLAEIFRRDPKLLRAIDPIRFEELVAELFEEDGYRVILTPPRADGGKDIYVYRSDDKLQTSWLVECKRYVPPNKVGVETARQLYGIVQHERRSGGVIVTTSYFTRGAKEFAETVPYQLFLRDFDDLQTWLQKPMMSNE
jgi:restriction endonuclease Mrr